MFYNFLESLDKELVNYKNAKQVLVLRDAHLEI